MKLGWAFGVVALASTAAILRPDVAAAFYQQVYPSDPAQRRALDQCALENRSFDRLDSADRETCYRRSPLAYQAAGAVNATGAQLRLPAAPNSVDQRRAAAEGRLPGNDIRAEQRGELYLRAAATAR